MSFSLSPAFPLKPPPPLRSHRSDNRRPEHPAARHLDGGAAASLKPWRFGVGSGLKSREWSGRKRRRFRCEAQLGDLAPVTSAVYGSLLLGGGLFAFSRSGSKGSLAGGCTGAVLMATAYYLMQAPETKSIGYALGFGAALLFSSVFGIRLVATQKLTPAGPLLGLSVLALAVFLSAYLQDSI
ncbi:protein FATTY ACID EXPORT 4, chloroplastic isoform X2 [Eucalyptus grandis]|uniref:protein FATTY ACID EXPORT 4, chloroplastic isoform X2 n=1 Tax=Eucalyptus grandis TaxID=71139 RepID=UPI00192E90CF|nr:protein FATTY ACID EXPORT 4, chloroplastic isoform X2 [Eucalyptus grandis]XP_039167313.1 protein FATTY ACID EXPORT 4, chloroplastic isoform X2 [Eucalyptus grandis]